MWKTEITPGRRRTARVKSSISLRSCTARRTATIAWSGRPRAARSISAWNPSSTPASRSARTRARHVDGAMPTASASLLLGIRASRLSAPRIARSVSSSGCASFGMATMIAGGAELSAEFAGFTEFHSVDRRSHRTRGTLSDMRTTADASTVVKSSILEAIGDTPLVRLERIGAGLTPELVAKVEYLNPGGWIKDRIAVALVDAAEREGKLKPGGTIVEPTSGNTGVGLAIAARLRGYRMIAVMPDKMSNEKIDLLRAYGAEVVVAPTDVPPSSPESYYRVADRLAEEIPGAFQPNQYFNQANPEAHYRSTGPELWEQTGGRITHLVLGVGTGGTVTGAGRYLKERNPAIEIVGADPVGSIYSNDEVKSYLVEGVGEDFWPETFDRSLVDRWVTVSDRDAFLMTRRMAAEEGLLIGGSGGLAAFAALKVAEEITDPDAMVVVVLPDGGRSYLSKIYNDASMTQYGFLERPGGDPTLGDVLRRKHENGEMPPLVTVRTHDTVRNAVALLHEHRVSQLPVVSAHDPHAVVGSVGERGLLKHAVEDSKLLSAEVIHVMEPPFPAVSAEDSAGGAVELLSGEREALLVTVGGRPAGVVTRTDLLEALAR